MEEWPSFLVRNVRASYTLHKLGAFMCLLTPFTYTQLILPSLHTLAELCDALLDYIDQPLITTPAFIFLMCNLIVLAIIMTSIMGRPCKKIVPYNFLHFPFKPIETISFTSNIYTEEAPPLSDVSSCIFDPTYSKHWPSPSAATRRTLDLNASSPTITVTRSKFGRSRSHGSISSAQPTLKTISTIFRSPSHNTYLNMKPLLAAEAATENDLTDEEANQRFNAFIEYRFATMKREMLD